MEYEPEDHRSLTDLTLSELKEILKRSVKVEEALLASGAHGTRQHPATPR
jgi:hypothetical protein